MTRPPMGGYAVVLTLHSLLRWVLLLLGGVVLVRAWRGWRAGRRFASADRRLSLALLLLVDLQLLLGLWLYAGLSGLVRAAWLDLPAAMGVSLLRFWAVEHPFGMLLGVIGMHVTYLVARRRGAEPARHRLLLIGLALSLVPILVAIPWPGLGLAYGRSLFRF